MKILVADDDRVLTHLIHARLRALGWTVTVAHDAMQALMFAMRIVPDAILLDIDMPGGTGVEAIRKLKVSTKTSQIPIVVLTGSIDPGEESRIRALGAEGFMMKPPDIDALHALLTELAEPAKA